MNTQDEKQNDAVVDSTSPISLPISDNEFLRLVNKKISDANVYYDKIGLNSRSKRNEKYYKGGSDDDEELEDWQIDYKDNMIYQDEETRLSLAGSRLPDIVVVPSSKDAKASEIAKLQEKALNITLKSSNMQCLVKDILRQRDIKFRSAVKITWDKTIGDDGDYLFKLVDVDKLILDPNANIPHFGFTTDNMQYIAEFIEEPVGEVLAKFPDKKDEIFKELGYIKGTTAQMASIIRYTEFHFTWYDKDGKNIEGVGWKYGDVVLKTQKTPYWDWDGKEISSEEPNEMGEFDVETVYKNFFDRPRKPYILATHINLGKDPIDVTTPIEQAIPLQRIINKRGRQITEISDSTVGKLGFAGEYISKDRVEEMSTDPKEYIYLDSADDIRKAVTVFPGSQVSPILYQDLVSNRGQIDSKFSTHSTTRGETVDNASGKSKQITREGDLTISDDLVNITIVRLMSEMAQWATQMMVTQYKTPHFVRNLGKDGELVEIELQRDNIDAGVSIMVDASTVDKSKRRSEALLMASQRNIDPLSMFEDMDLPNPKERTRRLVSFLMGVQDGYSRYSDDVGLDEKEKEESEDKAVEDIKTLVSGGEVEPEDIDEAYLRTFIDFVGSDAFGEIPPQAQQKIQEYVSRLKGMAGGSGAIAPDGQAMPEQPLEGNLPEEMPPPQTGMV